MATKFELECLSGTMDFSLWRKITRSLLVHEKVAKALDKNHYLDHLLRKKELKWMR